MDGLYNPTSDFVAKPGHTLWTESEATHGGVAILLNPYSSITEMEPWHEKHWTPHWMADIVTIMGEAILVVHVYAPDVKREQEVLFERSFSAAYGSIAVRC